MRLVFMAGATIMAAVSLLVTGPAHAQGTAGRMARSGPALPGGPAASCDNLPPNAVTSVPAPFDAYMRLMCREPLGQGLQAVQGFRWTAREGQPIGLTATSAAGGPDANGLRQFPTSWYVELSPMVLPPGEQRRLKLDFRRAIQTRFLNDAVILGLRARTSNNEEKLIFLVLPGAMPKAPDWLIGLECNGACFRRDATPLMFAGSPGLLM